MGIAVACFGPLTRLASSLYSALRTSYPIPTKQKAKTMATYEVTYTEGEAIKSEMVEAANPVEATRLFYEKYPDGAKAVLCVVRQ